MQEGGLRASRREETHLKYRGNSRPNVLNASLRHAIKVAHATPTAREGEKWPKCRSSDSQQKEYYKERPMFTTRGTSGSVDRKLSSGLDRMHLSRTSAPCHWESHMKSVAVQTRLRVAGEAGSHRGCAKTGDWRLHRAARRRRRFPLRA